MIHANVLYLVLLFLNLIFFLWEGNEINLNAIPELW
jgi:hypothetical protein